MIIAILETKPIIGVLENSGATETGQYTITIKATDGELREHEDTRRFVLGRISLYLANSIRETDVPMNMWLVRFPTKIQREFALPEVLDMEHPNAIPR